jgi:hypothetical protein
MFRSWLQRTSALLFALSSIIVINAFVLNSATVSAQTTAPVVSGKTRVAIPSPDPLHGLKSFPQHRIPVLVPGSTPERRAAWNSLSDSQKQAVTTLFQSHLQQAAAALKAKAASSPTPSHFSETLNGATLSLAATGKDLINATVGYFDAGGTRHLISAASPVAGSLATSAPSHSFHGLNLSALGSSGQLIYAPIPKHKNEGAWSRMNAVYSPERDGGARLMLSSTRPRLRSVQCGDAVALRTQ